MSDRAYTEADLAPGERLVIEVLAARWRLDESLWTFDSDHSRWINSLADKGLVNPMHGIVEKTLRASLTEAGKRYYWEDSVPARGESGEEKSESLRDLVPKKWLSSKKKTKRTLAKVAHPNLKKIGRKHDREADQP